MRAKAGFFSLTPVAPADGSEAEYLRWHLLDHMPEQYQLPGIVHGLRWTAEQAHRDARLVATEPLQELGNIVHYVLGDPVEQTLADFIELGSRLREAGRFPITRPPLRLAALRLQTWYSSPRALVSAEVVPFRPHRGVMLVIEEPTNGRPDRWLQWLRTHHYPALLAEPGTAGAWMFGTPYVPTAAAAAWATGQHYVTVVYLDEDPIATAERLRPAIEERWDSGEVTPLYAGPLRSMIAWDAWM
jgi:hypothetical protein